mgnify:FL=1|tara:strand:- start:10 stop:897 length:888 start_codon:yes stop_codon:yes gene_type:complete
MTKNNKGSTSVTIGVLCALVSVLLISCGGQDKTQVIEEGAIEETIEEAPEEEVPEEEAPEEQAPEEEAEEEAPEEEAPEEEAPEEIEVSFDGDCSTTTVGDLLDPNDWFYLPTTGSVVAVVGVEHWDILEIHEDPGVSSPLIDTLDPLDDTVVALGFARQLPQSIWWCISWEGGSGAWASSIYLSRLADPWQNYDSDRWVGLNAENLEGFLAEVESEYERDPNSEGGPMRIVISELDYSNNIVSFDVIGFLDDSVAGARLTFTATTQSDGSVTVTEVQYRAMCRRGGGPGSDLCL